MKKALIVDDNEQNLYLLQIVLKGHGYDVMMAANGAEALELARSDPPDIIISDILMPVMDGFALCREWKKDERLQQIPFIFYTATYTDSRDEELALSLGAAHFIVKPQDPEAFAALLRQVIEGRETGRPVAPAQPAPEETGYYKLYSEALIRKLEDKMLAVEDINRALKESEKRYRLLAENIQDVIFVLDLDLNYTYVSPSVKALRGYEPEEVLEQSASETLTPASWDLAVKTITEEMELEKAGQVDLRRSRTLELEMRRKDGTTVCTEVKVSFIRDEDGRPTGILGVTRDITERNKVEALMRENERRLKKAQSIAHIGSWELQIPTNELIWSDEIYRLFDLDPKVFEATYEAFLKAIHPDDREFVDKAYTDSVKSRTPYDIVHRLLMRDGSIRYVNEHCETHYDGKGNPIRSIGTVQDITERKEAEEALRLSEQKFITAFQSSPTAITITSAEDGLIVEVNETFLRITGYEYEEVFGHTFKELKLWVDNAARDRYVALLSEHGRVVEMEADFRIKSGDVRNGLVSGALMEIGGRPHILGVTLDITERRRMEEAIREREVKYRELFESIVDVFYQTDMEGTLLIVSPSVEKLLGYLPDEVVGKKLSGFYVNPEEREKFLLLLREEEGIKEFEAPLRTKDGSVVIVSTNAQLYRDKRGNILGVRGISRDVTRRKQAEEKVQSTLESLRKAVSATVQIVATTVEARDPYTAGHQIRSADLACAIATEMKLPQEKIDAIRMAGSIHDIGKIAVPAEILSKPTKLTEIEFSLIKEHSRRGYEILRGAESPWNLAEIAYQHHERLDGSGYPRNLNGDEILIEARILAIADVVESMASHRPYRPALGIGAALEEIEKNRGILYDADAADACLRLFRGKGYELPKG